MPKQFQYITGIYMIPGADGLAGFKSPAACKYSQALKKGFFRLSQKIIAPINQRLKGLMSWQGCSIPAGQQTKNIIQSRCDLFHRQHAQARGSKLDCQRDAIQAAADLRNRAFVTWIQVKSWNNICCAIDK